MAQNESDFSSFQGRKSVELPSNSRDDGRRSGGKSPSDGHVLYGGGTLQRNVDAQEQPPVGGDFEGVG